jgi:hypothetical protein
MNVDQLDILVSNGVIKSYTLDRADENGLIGNVSQSRNIEILVLEFNSGHKLRMETFCSGCSEDTVFSFELLK